MSRFNLDNCSIEECQRPIQARGYCGTHLQRIYRTGSPHIVRKRVVVGDLQDRLEARIDKTEGCWQWTGSLSAAGYGQVGDSGLVLYAHRVAYETYVAPIPDGLTIDHLCRNRACVNPAHMEVVTRAENCRRGTAIREANRVQIQS